MGIFGPTKKGGGLDMRFKSNRGGYLGKAVNAFGALQSGSEEEDTRFELTEKEKEGAKLHSRMCKITVPEGKDELIELLDELGQYISDEQIMALSGITDSAEIGWHPYFGSAQRLAQSLFSEACEKLKELSIEESRPYEELMEPIRAKERSQSKVQMKKMKKIAAVVILLILFAIAVNVIM